MTLWYVAVLALVLLGFSLAVYLTLTNSLYSNLDNLLETRAGQLEANFNQGEGQVSLGTGAGDEEGSILPSEGEILLLFDKQGTLLQKIGPLSPLDIKNLIMLALSSASSSSSGQNPVQYFTNYELSPYAKGPENTGKQFDFRLYVTRLQGKDQPGLILILGSSREEQQTTARKLLLVLLITIPITLLISALGGYWLASRAMQPVRLISRTARQMGQNDLSKRFNLRRQDELGELATTFDQMLARLESAFNRQKQFTADASHELRTPLSIIRLEAEQALEERVARTLNENRQAWQIIKTESEHMSRLVNDLLTLARADSGGVTLNYEELDLSELALEVVERFQNYAGRNGVNLHMAQEELEELPVRGDYLYLNRMINNLVENAIKYRATRPAQQPWVAIKTGQEGGKWAWIEVSDNGQGIPARYLPHIFDRFYRVDSARTSGNDNDQPQPQMKKNSSGIPRGNQPEEVGAQASGSGLGLAIAKWVAQAHGGSITVESRESLSHEKKEEFRPEKGEAAVPGEATTRFRVCLPLEVPAQE
ncbi:MAG TPA: ATP-binding protein [Chloroflexia bacterium]|nr:ATP-binding protein [Chloroflexia bacterium]